MPYDVHLEIFEGPLDLLLYLIKKSDLEISDIPIAQITKEYLDYINIMKELNLEIAGEFLVMASTLMQIKARMLLPVKQDEQEEGGPDPLEELKSKLMEYQKYKEVAKGLSQRESYYSNVYYRPAPVFEKDDFVLDVSLFDLLSSFRSILTELPANVKEIVYEEIPIEEKIREILDLLEDNNYLSFIDILKREKTRIGLILCFLAMLELIRLKQIIAKQTETFGEIRVYRVKDEEKKEIQQNSINENEQKDPNQEELDLYKKDEEIKEIEPAAGIEIQDLSEPGLNEVIDEDETKLDSKEEV